MAISVQIKDLNATLGGRRVLNGITLDIAAGELFFLLGPSGCGKTTLLRSVAGFVKPASGSIHFGDQEVTALPPEQREAAMVFQSYALWPHLTVAQNVAFGLELRKLSATEIKQRVAESLDVVKMGDRAAARPNELSGGQQQRVALARALAVRPRCLLLDEPLSNLDAKLRHEMRGEIRRICKQAELTAIYVTHDQKEALAIADRLAVLEEGRIQQCGTPWEVYRRPAKPSVAAFIGETNFIAGKLQSAENGICNVATQFGVLKVTTPSVVPAAGQAVTLCIRPESLQFCATGSGAVNQFAGVVRDSIFLGELAQHLVQPAGTGTRVLELRPQRAAFPAGTPVTLCFAPGDAVLLSG
ncbi:MAG: ABC transporter ATP-binding protein [Kiritimatiellaeota bacterium]|nr:ABC transporter ATP-binding protein [Kiritimatiellota bacterium]